MEALLGCLRTYAAMGTCGCMVLGSEETGHAEYLRER